MKSAPLPTTRPDYWRPRCLVPWPWDSRGRQAVTAASVAQDLSALRRELNQRMRSTANGGTAAVAIGSDGWC